MPTGSNISIVTQSAPTPKSWNSSARFSPKKLKYLKMQRISRLRVIFAALTHFCLVPFQSLQNYAAGKTAERGKRNQNEETPVPPAVEDVAYRHYKEVLPTQRLENKPIEQEYYWQEY